MTNMPASMPASAIPEWTLGWRLQRALAHAGVSVEAIAVEIGVSRSTVSRWMNDRGAEPRAGYIKLWALRCGVPYEWLRTGTDGGSNSWQTYSPPQPRTRTSRTPRRNRLTAVPDLHLAYPRTIDHTAPRPAA